LALQAKSKPPVLPTIQPVAESGNNGEDEEDDDIPLAVRRMTMMNAKSGSNAPHDNEDNDDDDDDIPLSQRHIGAAHAQQQQQQQQQQQYQQHNQMTFQQPMFAPPMMHDFGMPMGMPMMGMPMMNPYMGMNPSMMSIPQLQPPQDPAIDRWRRGVKVKEGSVAGSVISGRAPSFSPSRRS
jgi:hypothetical protein